ncbi:hypothetical protein ACH41H_32160 [Streptomyces sp. NPDC020800]|uniref:hypothetical protein n=1 Tax=Streptomyces sp. NPDC020800 TaxID=3365092 RepID=UPI0037939408
MSGAAAFVGVAALVVAAVPAGAALAGTAPPGAGEMTAGQAADPPAPVSGLSERAPTAATPAGAARAYLAA